MIFHQDQNNITMKRINNSCVTTYKMFSKKPRSRVSFSKITVCNFRKELQCNWYNIVWKQRLRFCCEQVGTCGVNRCLFWLFCMFWTVYNNFYTQFSLVTWNNCQNRRIVSVISYFPEINNWIRAIKFIFLRFFFNYHWFFTKFTIYSKTKKVIIILFVIATI